MGGWQYCVVVSYKPSFEVWAFKVGSFLGCHVVRQFLHISYILEFLKWAKIVQPIAGECLQHLIPHRR
jgi:hypothetical protein